MSVLLDLEAGLSIAEGITPPLPPQMYYSEMKDAGYFDEFSEDMH